MAGGWFESVAEAIEIGRRAGVPVDIIHLKIAEHQMWGQMPELTATIAAARARGQDVQANVYPYRAGQNNLSSITHLIDFDVGGLCLTASKGFVQDANI